MTSMKFILINAVLLLGSFKEGFCQDGESIVETETEPQLNLTAYEMFTLTELLAEIVIRPCKAVNRPLMSSIKNFVFETLQKAENLKKRGGNNNQFLQTYVNLVNCLSFVDVNYEKQLKSLPSSYIYKDGRVRRNAENSEENEILSKKSDWDGEPDMMDYNKSFDVFYYYLFSITQKVCPLTRDTFSLDFMIPALEQTVDWLVKDGTMRKMAMQKLFHNDKMIHDLRKCDRSVIIEGKSDNTVKFDAADDATATDDESPTWLTGYY